MERTEIVNATQSMEIDVPVQLTHSTRRKTAYACVFAKACLKDPNIEEAIIHLSTAYIKFKGKKEFFRFKVGMRLRDQIVMFDRHGDFDPGLYTLSAVPPSKADRYGARQGASPALSTGRFPKRRGGVKLKGVRSRANIATL